MGGGGGGGRGDVLLGEHGQYVQPCTFLNQSDPIKMAILNQTERLVCSGTRNKKTHKKSTKVIIVCVYVSVSVAVCVCVSVCVCLCLCVYV